MGAARHDTTRWRLAYIHIPGGWHRPLVVLNWDFCVTWLPTRG
jgi:hypothetical protein